MKINYVLCDKVMRAWNMAMFDGKDRETAIRELSEQFRGEHLTAHDINFMYKLDPITTRYCECFIVTNIIFN